MTLQTTSAGQFRPKEMRNRSHSRIRHCCQFVHDVLWRHASIWVNIVKPEVELINFGQVQKWHTLRPDISVLTARTIIIFSRWVFIYKILQIKLNMIFDCQYSLTHVFQISQRIIYNKFLLKIVYTTYTPMILTLSNIHHFFGVSVGVFTSWTQKLHVY